jgi:hypothetical protein
MSLHPQNGVFTENGKPIILNCETETLFIKVEYEKDFNIIPVFLFFFIREQDPGISKMPGSRLHKFFEYCGIRT